MVHHQHIKKIFVGLGNPAYRNRKAHSTHHDSRGSGYGFIANDGTNRSNSRLCPAQRFTDAGHREYGPNATDRIAGRKYYSACLKNSVNHARGRFCFGRTGKTDRVHWVLIPALHEIFLKAELAAGRVHASLDARVTHGENARLNAEFLSDGSSDIG